MYVGVIYYVAVALFMFFAVDREIEDTTREASLPLKISYVLFNIGQLFDFIVISYSLCLISQNFKSAQFRGLVKIDTWQVFWLLLAIGLLDLNSTISDVCLVLKETTFFEV